MSEALPISIERHVTHMATRGHNGAKLSAQQMITLMRGVVAGIDRLGELAKLVRAVKVSPKYPYSGSRSVIYQYKIVLSGPYADECEENTRLEARGQISVSPEGRLTSKEISDGVFGAVKFRLGEFLKEQDRRIGGWKAFAE